MNKIKSHSVIAALSVAMLLSSHAAIIDVARYRLGEAGSLTASPNSFPIDSLSTDAFVANFINGGTPISTIVPGSTAALSLGSVPTGY